MTFLFSLNYSEVSVLSSRVHISSHKTMHSARAHTDNKACMQFIMVLFVQCNYRRAGMVKTHATQHINMLDKHKGLSSSRRRPPERGSQTNEPECRLLMKRKAGF